MKNNIYIFITLDKTSDSSKFTCNGLNLSHEFLRSLVFKRLGTGSVCSCLAHTLVWVKKWSWICPTFDKLEQLQERGTNSFWECQLKTRKQDLILDLPLFICWIDCSEGAIIIWKETWRNHSSYNKSLKFVRLYNDFNLFPMEVIGIMKFVSYQILEKLATGWEGARIDHFKPIISSWYHIRFWYEEFYQKKNWILFHSC